MTALVCATASNVSVLQCVSLSKCECVCCVQALCGVDVVPESLTRSVAAAAAVAASSLGSAYSSQRSSGPHKPSLLSVHWLRR